MRILVVSWSVGRASRTSGHRNIEVHSVATVVARACHTNRIPNVLAGAVVRGRARSRRNTYKLSQVVVNPVPRGRTFGLLLRLILRAPEAGFLCPDDLIRHSLVTRTVREEVATVVNVSLATGARDIVLVCGVPAPRSFNHHALRYSNAIHGRCTLHYQTSAAARMTPPPNPATRRTHWRSSENTVSA